MKSLMFLTLTFVLLVPVSMNGQATNLDKIRQVVDDRYPGYEIDEVEKESWCKGESMLEVEIERGEEEAEEEMTLLFTSDGTLRYSESSINPSGLPKAVKDGFRKACPGCKAPKEADKLTAMDGGETLFEVEGRKGLRKVSYLIRENGDLLCKN